MQFVFRDTLIKFTVYIATREIKLESKDLPSLHDFLMNDFITID